MVYAILLIGRDQNCEIAIFFLDLEKIQCKIYYRADFLISRRNANGAILIYLTQ